jgi:hypothetical protein
MTLPIFFMIKIKRCDNCGKFNPPTLCGNKRLCGACAHPGGFYRRDGDTLGTDGKINYWRLQLPFRITWRGWWRL